MGTEADQCRLASRFLPTVKTQLAPSPWFVCEAVSGIYRGLNQGPISSEWKFLSLEFSGATGSWLSLSQEFS